MKRFALVGAGFIGRAHARNLAAHPGIDLAVIHDVDERRATALAVEFNTAASIDLADVFDAPDIDAVLIASSTNTHAHHLYRAAAAKKAVLCEKPLDLSIEAARDAVRAIEAAGVTAMVDFNRRFDRDYATIAACVSAGEIGNIELVQMTTRGPAVPSLEYLAVSGGQMHDQTVHFFDLACWITGDDPIEVFAMGAALADPRVADIGDVDTSAVTLRFAGGALCQVDSMRRIGYGYDERIEVVGSTGMVESGRQRQGSVSRYLGNTVVQDGLHNGWFERMRDSYAHSLDAFVSALETGRAPAPSLADGLRAQVIAEAATRSLREGQPVALNLTKALN